VLFLGDDGRFLAAVSQLSPGFLRSLLFDPEDGGDMLVRNVG
jgi:hypothetical protein